MVNDIIKALKKGSIKTVLLYSDTNGSPAPPYVVVKPETGTMPNTRQFRIIVYHMQGKFDELEKYTLIELDQLLAGIKLYKNGYSDVTSEMTDKTFFMERLYIVPMMGTH